jgi:hypothetical protein
VVHVPKPLPPPHGVTFVPPQASLALSHVQEQHRQSLAKLKQESQSESSSHASTRALGGNGSPGNLAVTPAQRSNVLPWLQAQVLEEWSQLEDRKKARMRAEAVRLTVKTREKQAQHEQSIAVLRARAENATTAAARATFEDQVRAREAQHARELVSLEAQARRSYARHLVSAICSQPNTTAQATESLALIEQEFSSRAAEAKPEPGPTASLLASSRTDGSTASRVAPLCSASPSQDEAQRVTGAPSVASHSQAPKSEAKQAAISWLHGQERSIATLAAGAPDRLAPAARTDGSPGGSSGHLTAERVQHVRRR